jgi:glycosyltransferase involved in cell wall biosynthesis
MNAPAKKPKIVWLAHEGDRSGANVALLGYLDALRDTYDFHVILPHQGNMTDALGLRNIPFSVIRQYGWTDRIGRLNGVKRFKIHVRTQLAIRQTEQLLRQENPSLVFTNTLVPFVGALAAYRSCIPHVWWIHEFGEEDFGFSVGWGQTEKAYQQMQNWSRLIICNSKAVATKFRQLMPRIRVEHIYYPVSWRGNAGGGKKLAKFLIFGQIAPAKGHKEVLQALARNKVKNLSCGGLHIKGPSENKEYLQELQQIVKEKQLNKEVKIEPGFFVAEELMPLYEVLLVASRSEAFGLVIIEAIKAGLKVVVKNRGGAPELVNETNGLLYDTEEELSPILSGIKKLPEGPSFLNYTEEMEIEKLKRLLNELS